MNESRQEFQDQKPVRQRSPSNGVISRRPSDTIHLKILVPSIAAGAIIGKGGEAIAQIQNEVGAKIKLSKVNDFYPGTTERVCLIQGGIDGVRKMHNYIMDRILEKPEIALTSVMPASQSVLLESSPVGGIVSPTTLSWVSALGVPVTNQTPINRLLWERHRQVKILVPNCTAGLVIGKLGSYVTEIKERTGAFIQISQKSKDISLPERCITIAGEPEQLRSAVNLVLVKIAEDPQSGACPNISYAHIQGPVANAYPTGSPFAFSLPQMPAYTGCLHSDRPEALSSSSSSQLTNQLAGQLTNQLAHQLALQAALGAASQYQQEQRQRYLRAQLKSSMQGTPMLSIGEYVSPSVESPRLENIGFPFATPPPPAPTVAGGPLTQSQLFLTTASSLFCDLDPQQLAYYRAGTGYPSAVDTTASLCSLYAGLDLPETASSPQPGLGFITPYPQSLYALPQVSGRGEQYLPAPTGCYTYETALFSLPPGHQLPMAFRGPPQPSAAEFEAHLQSPSLHARYPDETASQISSSLCFVQQSSNTGDSSLRLHPDFMANNPRSQGQECLLPRISTSIAFNRPQSCILTPGRSSDFPIVTSAN